MTRKPLSESQDDEEGEVEEILYMEGTQRADPDLAFTRTNRKASSLCLRLKIILAIFLASLLLLSAWRKLGRGSPSDESVRYLAWLTALHTEHLSMSIFPLLLAEEVLEPSRFCYLDRQVAIAVILQSPA